MGMGERRGFSVWILVKQLLRMFILEVSAPVLFNKNGFHAENDDGSQGRLAPPSYQRENLTFQWEHYSGKNLVVASLSLFPSELPILKRNRWGIIS